MSNTPRTDALSTDPTIERRDVPNRVWREMAALERENAELAGALVDIAKCVRPRAYEDEITRAMIIVNLRRLLEFHQDLLLKHIEQKAKRGKGAT